MATGVKAPVSQTTMSTRRPWLAFSVLLTGAFMDSVDATMMTVMVPTIRADLGASETMVQWTVAGYLLSFAMLLVAGGRCGDVFGKRRTFAVGAAIFGLASVWCAVTTTDIALVLGRVLQGAGAPGMLPQAAAMVSTSSPRNAWPAAFGVFGAVLSVGSVGGPLIGGLLTAANVWGLGWRAAFLVNVLCLVAVVAARWLPDDRATTSGRLDLGGVLLSSVGASALLVPLVNGRELGWPLWCFALMLVAIPMGWAFWARQRRLGRPARGIVMPLVPPRLFSSTQFGEGLLMALVVYMAVTSCLLIVSLVLQGQLGWSIVRTAVVTAAWPLGIAATFQIGWRAGGQLERQLLPLGCLLMAAGALLLAWFFYDSVAVPDWQIAVGLAVLGGGMGLTSPMLTSRVLGQVLPEDSGVASGVLNAVVQFGGATGVAVLGTLFFLFSGHHGASVTLVAGAVLLVLGAVISTQIHTHGQNAAVEGDA